MNSCIKLNAGNDRNGNPRRLWIVMSSRGSVVSVIEDSGAGREPLDRAYPEFRAWGYHPAEFWVTPAEYRGFKKQI